MADVNESKNAEKSKERRTTKGNRRNKGRVKALSPETAKLAATLERSIPELIRWIDKSAARRTEALGTLRSQCLGVQQSAKRVISKNYSDLETRRRLLLLEGRLRTIHGDLMSIRNGLSKAEADRFRGPFTL